MGIVYTTANRNWELHLALVDDRLRQSRALAVDMESATVAANGVTGSNPVAPTRSEIFFSKYCPSSEE